MKFITLLFLNMGFLFCTDFELSKLPLPSFHQLFQHWQKPPYSFENTKAWFGANETEFYLLAEVEDSFILNDATQHNDYFWEKGDLIELLLKQQGVDHYYEFQITPNNFRFAVKWPSQTYFKKVIQSKDWKEHLKGLYQDPLRLKSEVSVNPQFKNWSVSIRIPYEMVETTFSGMKKTKWRYSICRNNLLKSKKTEISSSSEFSKSFFHELEKWNHWRFY